LVEEETVEVSARLRLNRSLKSFLCLKEPEWLEETEVVVETPAELLEEVEETTGTEEVEEPAGEDKSFEELFHTGYDAPHE
jgi:hypothetical protein